MASLARPRFSPEQYLTQERQAEFKSEYLAGELFAMAGASYTHNLIVANVLSELRNALRGSPCRAVANDQRVLIVETGLYTYPDLVIVCGEPHFSDDHLDTLLNPALIIEVLSPSNEAYDRGEKFAHYRRLNSLSDYVLISQDKMRVEHFTREGERWVLSEISMPNDKLSLPSFNCIVQLNTFYEYVKFTTS